MEFTGERYVPSVDGQIRYEHLHRYALCLEFVKGRSVLDLASGEGYGSVALAKVAHSVIGVDIDAASIEHANYQYRDCKNLKFLVGSCDSLPLPDESVEVVTSFETIEHHDKHEEMMLEIKRVLKPGGLLIISSPNRLVYSDEPKYSNPYHVKELYYNELVSLLGRHFKEFNIFGQRLASASFVSLLESSSSKNYAAYTGEFDNLREEACSLQSPVYFVAICSDESQSIKCSVESIYIDAVDDLFKLIQNDRIQSQIQLEKYQSDIEQSHSQLELTLT